MHKENYNLKGKRAFITGGGRGIGLCSKDALAEAGVNYLKQLQTDSPILMGLA